MKKSIVLALALTGAAGALSAHAADAPAAAHTFTANANLVSEYRFRGIDQTWGQSALQGGFDYAHADGWYAGVWGSNVSANSYPGGSSLELDYYGGYNGKFDDDFGWTVGGYGYWYPGANFNKAAMPGADQKFDNFELNAGLSWKFVSYKLSVSTTDYFGANTKTGYTSGSKNTLYHDLSVNYPLMDDLTLGFHIGRTDVKTTTAGRISPDYTDYKLSLAKTFKDGWNTSLAYVKSSNDAFFKNTASFANSEVRDLNKGVLMLQAGRTF